MRCHVCARPTAPNVPICEDCFIKELLWYFKDDPSVYEDIEYVKQPDGTIKEVGIIQGIEFIGERKKEATR
jgi:hypothetical protein